MNSLTRALGRIAYSSSHARAPAAARKSAALQRFLSTATSPEAGNVTNSGSGGVGPKTYVLTQTPKKSASQHSWPRPTEIPYQVKVANSVNLIGYVGQPVQFEASADGKFWAGTVISQRPSSNSSPLWIPIIFEGDLAHIAACHLKKNDHIHIAGQLFTDSLTHSHGNLQVIVHNLNFVDGSFQSKQNSAPQKEEGALNHSASLRKDGDPLWRDLVDDPKAWWDCRDNKRNGLVKPNYPDFKRKDDGLALWLDKAPHWVLSKLEGVEFDVLIPKPKQARQHKGDELWKDLVKNPDNWWDNRLNKKSEKGPDFKHKKTGEVLWLTSSPTWVLSELPPVKSK